MGASFFLCKHIDTYIFVTDFKLSFLGLILDGSNKPRKAKSLNVKDVCKCSEAGNLLVGMFVRSKHLI